MADNEALGVLLSKIVVDLSDMKKNLSEGRREMQGFKDMAQGVGQSVKQALTFAGVSVGIYEIATALKSFAQNAAMVGARTETLEIAMQQVGKTYGVSAQSLKFYVDELKRAGITTQESMTAVTKALTTGIPLNQLKDLATRARDIAVVAGINTSEALNRMMQGIISGEQETLRRLMIQVGHTDDIYKRFAATLGKTKEQLNAVEKTQAMLNEVMRLSAGFAGIAAAADASVGKQLQSMARFAEEARIALWALFAPVMGTAVQEMTQGWMDLKKWADANQKSLKSWGAAIGSWVTTIANAGREVVNFIGQHQALIKALLEIAVLSKISGWVIGLGTALAGVIPKILQATIAVTGLKLACSGPWSIVITVALGGVLYGINKIRELHNELDALQKNAGISGRGPLTTPGETFKVKTTSGISSRGVISPELQAKLQEEENIANKARQEAAAANAKAQADAPKSPGKGGGGGGKGGKETTDNLLAPTQALYKAQRDAALQHYQNQFDLLKASNEKEKAELERKLAEGLIDGQTYYQSLQDLQQQETTAALAMIEEKKQAQTKAYQESLAQLNQDEKLSDAAKDIARQKLEIENKKTLAKLDTEAKQVELEGAKKITEELKRQVEVRTQYQQATEDLNLETAQLMGSISDQEAKLQKLVIDWQRAKESALKAGGLTPGYSAALDKNLKAKKDDAKYGETMKSIGSDFTTGIKGIIEDIRNGTLDITKSLSNMINNITMSALKPSFDALGKALASGIKYLVDSASSAMGLGGSGGGGFFSSLFGGADAHNWKSLNSASTGGVFHRGVVQAFAGGGIFTRPTLFPMANGMGLAGEAGEEGVLPLSRIGGDLGVKALFPSSGNVTVINNLGKEADAQAKQTDDGLEIVLDKMMANTIARGGLTRKAILKATGGTDRPTRR